MQKRLFYHKYKTDSTYDIREITMEQRANIKFFVKLGQTFTETLTMLRKAYGNKALSRISVRIVCETSWSV